jgi:hypothetical protein
MRGGEGAVRAEAAQGHPGSDQINIGQRSLTPCCGRTRPGARADAAAYRLPRLRRDTFPRVTPTRVEGRTGYHGPRGLGQRRGRELDGSADRALAAARAVVAESAGKAGYPMLWRQAALAVELCQRAVEITARVLPGSYRPGSRTGADIRR